MDTNTYTVSATESLGRDRDHTETDSPDDWRDHGGANASAPSPGERNIDVGSIVVRNAPNGTGDAVGATSLRVNDSLELYAAGYDPTGALIGDVECTWSATGTLDSVPAGPAPNTTFTAQTVNTTGTIVAEDTEGNTDQTGTISVIDPTDTIAIESGATATLDPVVHVDGEMNTTLYARFNDSSMPAVDTFKITFKIRNDVYTVVDNATIADPDLTIVDEGGGAYNASYRYDPPSTLPAGRYDLYFAVENANGSSAADPFSANPDELKIVTAAAATKTLYLHETGATDIMNTTVGSATQTVRVANDASVYWYQSPPLAGDLILDGTIVAALYLDPTAATWFLGEIRDPDATVTISAGGTVVGSKTLNDITNTGWYNFAIEPPTTVVNAGERISLNFTTSGAWAGWGGQDGYIDLTYDSATYDSHLDLSTSTYIDIEAISTHNATDTSEIFSQSEEVVAHINVSDPLGVYDIATVNATVLDPDGEVLGGLDDVAVSDIYAEDGSSVPYWRIYTFDLTLPADAPNGTYTIVVDAYESNGVVDTDETYFFVLGAWGVELYPDHEAVAQPDSSIDFSFNLANIGKNTDTYDLAPSASSEGWPSELYSAGTLLAEDTDGDGEWDWIFDDYDSNSNNRPDITLASLESAPLTLRKAVPPNTEGRTDTTSLVATSATDSTINDSVTATTVVTSTQATKTLHLHESGSSYPMDTLTGTATNTVRVMNDATHTWTQAPAFAMPFSLTGHPLVHLSIEPTPGTWLFFAAYPDVTVTLSYDGTTIGSTTIQDLSSAQFYTFDITPLATAIPAGAALDLEVAVANADMGDDIGYIDVSFDLSTYDSRVDLTTDTFVDVASVSTYNATGAETDLFDAGETVTVRANITDPLGAYDVSAALDITSPNGTQGDLVNDSAMSFVTSGPSTLPYWSIYEYEYILPAEDVNGTYTIEVRGIETNGVTANGTATFTNIGAAVDVSPGHGKTAPTTGINVTFSHYIENEGQFTDRFDIEIGTDRGWPTALYHDIDGDGALDGTDPLMARDSDGDGSWDLVNTTFYDTDGDGMPDLGEMAPAEMEYILLELAIPADAPVPSQENITITATSNIDDAVSDSSVDWVVVIPEYRTILVPLAIVTVLFVSIRRRRKRSVGPDDEGENMDHETEKNDRAKTKADRRMDGDGGEVFLYCP